MTNKEFMKRAFEIDRRLKARRRRLEYLRSRIEATSPQVIGIPKSSPIVSSVMEEQAVRILDLEMCIQKDERDLSKTRKEIKDAIDAIGNETLSTILQMRYLDYMSWEDIMASLDYCRSYLYELHGRALKLIQQQQYLFSDTNDLFF